MKRNRVRSVTTLGAAALVAQVLIFQACGGGNSPSTPGNGGSGQGQAGNGVGGTSSVAGTSGQGTGGTSSQGGTTGGGGSIGTGTGGASATGNARGMGFGLPACASSVMKNGTCAATDVQCCYKTCGPVKSGVKSEICQTSGTYMEMSACAFDDPKDYSCYKLPAAGAINAACPVGVMPVSGADCGGGDGGVAVPTCTACNSLQGMAGGMYSDSTGSAKTGYCVCQEANASGLRSWSCATDNGSWPCPGHPGC